VGCVSSTAEEVADGKAPCGGELDPICDIYSRGPLEGLSGFLSGVVKIACSFLISLVPGIYGPIRWDSKIQGASDWVDDTNVPTSSFVLYVVVLISLLVDKPEMITLPLVFWWKCGFPNPGVVGRKMEGKQFR
jgi:hypothetical protein